MKTLPTWKLISSSLDNQLAVMLLLVVESTGSSPGRPGFLMAINERGEMEGSLGGGIMEHKFIEMAKARFHSGEGEISLHRQIHNKAAATHQSGMICSGEQTNLLYLVREQDRESVDAIIDCITNHQSGLLDITAAGISFSRNDRAAEATRFRQTAEGWIYTQRVGYQNRLFIVGGGHCSLALSRIMRELDFYITLFEDRDALKTMRENEFAHEKEIVEDYGSLMDRIPAGLNNYVVVMTFGYRSDAVALQALQGKQFKYLGVLGSRSKIEKMFAELYAAGMSSEMIKRIHAPIGLPINSHTPEEVAISIAAEIVMVKNA